MVWAFGLAMATFSPTSSFSSVDLPTFGAPTSLAVGGAVVRPRAPSTVAAGLVGKDRGWRRSDSTAHMLDQPERQRPLNQQLAVRSASPGQRLWLAAAAAAAAVTARRRGRERPGPAGGSRAAMPAAASLPVESRQYRAAPARQAASAATWYH